jgi:hypothetical protein
MKIFRWAYFFILFFLGKYMDTFMRIMEFFLKHVNCYETLEHLFLGTWQHFFFKILTYFYNKNNRIFVCNNSRFFCCMWRYFCFCNDFFTYNDFFLKVTWQYFWYMQTYCGMCDYLLNSFPTHEWWDMPLGAHHQAHSLKRQSPGGVHSADLPRIHGVSCLGE